MSYEHLYDTKDESNRQRGIKFKNEQPQFVNFDDLECQDLERDGTKYKCPVCGKWTRYITVHFEKKFIIFLKQSFGCYI